MANVSYGLNVGHGYTKIVGIDGMGRELEPVVFPSLLTPAQDQVRGAVRRIPSTHVDGKDYWVGEDALIGGARSALSQDRLTDPVFIPVLVRHGLNRLGMPQEPGYGTSGLPAAWASDVDKAKQLGARIRQVASREFPEEKGRLQIIPEPVGAIYAMALNTDGEITGDEALVEGRVGVVDLGHYTVDVCIINKLRPEPASMASYDLGSSVPLNRIRALISGAYELDLSLFQVDTAVRQGKVKVAGQLSDLPAGWRAPLEATAAEIAARLVEGWGRGAALDRIIFSGGGAALEPLVGAIAERFSQALIAEQGQTDIARGYARLARRRLRGVR